MILFLILEHKWRILNNGDYRTSVTITDTYINVTSVYVVRVWLPRKRRQLYNGVVIFKASEKIVQITD